MLASGGKKTEEVLSWTNLVSRCPAETGGGSLGRHGHLQYYGRSSVSALRMARLTDGLVTASSSNGYLVAGTCREHRQSEDRFVKHNHVLKYIMSLRPILMG